MKYIDLILEGLANQEFYIGNDRYKWRMKDGREIFVDDMSNNHIINAKRMLKKHKVKHLYHKWVRIFDDELTFRALTNKNK